jgi:hypothetical protein
MTNEDFKIKMDIDGDDSIIYLKIPHVTVRRAVSGMMALVVACLGFIGLRLEVHTGTPETPPTEVQQ